MIWRHVASNFLTLLVVLLIAAAAAVAWGRAQYQGPGPSAQAACVQVAPGASLATVSAQLADQGVVSSAYIFRAGADAAGLAQQLKFGSFLVRPEASMADVARAITAGGPSTCGTEVIWRIGVRANSVVLRDLNADSGNYEETAKYDPAAEPEPQPITAALARPDARIRLAVAEGVTSWQVVEGLKAIPLLDGEVGPLPAEGSLAPDSYEIEPGGSRRAVIDRMEAAQAAILAAAWEARPFGLPYATAQEALIMASIVEKETGIAEERPQVASVFVNRLREGMRLETDPTVIYGVTGGRAVLDRGLRQSELDRETPYNTYRIEGLPPTPIANPGRAAIEAALNPDDTPYIFFVADGTGGHAFATTLEEHNANVARWRAIEAERAAAAESADG